MGRGQRDFGGGVAEVWGIEGNDFMYECHRILLGRGGA